MKTESRTARRTFLTRSGLTLAGIGTATLALPGLARAKASNERVRIAAIGVGGRCRNLISGFLARDDCDVVTLCDVYPERHHVGHASREIEEKRGKRPAVVRDYRRVLDDKSIDAVIIATPDRWHAPLTILACLAGKDVYVEKPPTHNIREGRLMVEAASRHSRIVQTGTQNRSAPYVLEALELVRSGAIGKVGICKVFNMKSGGRYTKAPDGAPLKGMDYDTWLGPAPHRPFNGQTVYGGGWHKYWDFSGGDFAGDGIHQMDIARWLIGRSFPQSVHATGGKYIFDDDREVPDTQIVTYDFGDLVMTAEETTWAPYMRKTNGQTRNGSIHPFWPQNSTRIELYGSKNLMILGRHGGGWQIFTGDGKVIKESYGRFPDPPHKENFIRSIKSREQPSAPPEEAHRSVTLIHLGNIAYRVGRPLKFAAKTEQIVGDDEAQSLARGSYRKGFELPDIA